MSNPHAPRALEIAVRPKEKPFTMDLMKKLLPLLLLLPIGGLFAQKVPPDCTIPFSFTASGQVTSNSTCGAPNGGANGNGIASWVLVFYNYNFSAISLLVQSAPDNNGAAGTWGTFGGTVLTSTQYPGSTGVNPNTATTSGFTGLAGYFPWMRVQLASVGGTGKVTGALYGFYNSTLARAGSGSGGGGGPTIAGTANQITVTGAGCTTPSTATCTISVPTNPIFNGTVTAAGFIANESFSGNFSGSGLTSGQVVLSVADIAGTAIVYVWPSTNGTAGQVLSDSGVTTCPTLPAGYPSVCHLLAWIAAGGGSGALTQIAQQTLSSPVSFVTFSSIPATFTTLILIVSTASSTGGTGTASIQMQFNGDSGGNYDWVYILGTISAATSGDAGSQTSLFVGNIPLAGDATNSAGSATITIPSYAATAFLHNFLANNFAIANSLTGSALQLIQTGGVWNNTAAINSITLNCSSGNFIAGSVFTLYGQS